MNDAILKAFELVGYPVKDVATGTRGICSGVAFGLFGEIEVRILMADRTSEWFEIGRVVKNGKTRILPPPRFFPLEALAS